MQKKILEDIADQLRQSGEYRIINKYHKPEGYRPIGNIAAKIPIKELYEQSVECL